MRFDFLTSLYPPGAVISGAGFPKTNPKVIRCAGMTDQDVNRRPSRSTRKIAITLACVCALSAVALTFSQDIRLIVGGLARGERFYRGEAHVLLERTNWRGADTVWHSGFAATGRLGDECTRKYNGPFQENVGGSVRDQAVSVSAP